MYCSVAVRGVIIFEDMILTEWWEPRQIAFLPGGRIEDGEDLKQCLRRELLEELSCAELVIGDYLGTIGHFWNHQDVGDSCLNHFFKVSIPPEIIPTAITAREPGRQLRWIKFAKLKEVRLTPPSLVELLLGNQYSEEWSVIDREEDTPII